MNKNHPHSLALAALLLFALPPLNLAEVLPPTKTSAVAEVKQLQQQVIDVVKKCHIATINLTSGDASGSGVVVNADGLIITAAHVTRGYEEMTVQFHDGREATAKILGSNYSRDLSLAQIQTPGPWPHVAIGQSANLKPTEIVVALGHPGGYDIRRPAPVRFGRINATNADGFIVSDCTLVGGDSGGPLFNLQGQIIAIHSSIGDHISFNRHAPVDAARADWQKLFTGERWGDLTGAVHAPDHPTIGLSIQENTNDGIRVKSVLKNSPAAKAGITPNDLLQKINTTDITTFETFTSELRKARVGIPLPILIQRDGKTISLNIKPVAREKLLPNQPPTEQPPTEQPPTEQPPTEQPPTEQPPTEQPPTEQPPTEQPPTEQPPTEQPPTEQPPTSHPALGFEMTNGPTVRITKIEINSPAAQAGLKIGDTILQLNDTNIQSADTLQKFLKTSKPGQEYTLKIKTWDGEKTIKLKVTSK